MYTESRALTAGRPRCGMRIAVTDSALVPDLMAFLEERLELVSARLGESEIEVSLIGSLRVDAMRMELDLKLAIWRARHPGVGVAILDLR